MKNIIKLWVNGEGYKSFEYENLTDIANEFSSRNIKIGYGSSIGDSSSIGSRSSIGNGSSIGDGSSIGYGSSIGDSSSIGSRSSIGDSSSIGSRSSIGNGSSIGDSSSIGYGVKVKALFFAGTKHSVSYWGEDKIQIGCKQYSISEWESKYKQIGNIEGYSEEQLEEYAYYIECVINYHNKLNPVK